MNGIQQTLLKVQKEEQSVLFLKLIEMLKGKLNKGVRGNGG